MVVSIHRRLGKPAVHIHLMLKERGVVLSVSGVSDGQAGIRNILRRYPEMEYRRQPAQKLCGGNSYLSTAPHSREQALGLEAHLLFGDSSNAMDENAAVGRTKHDEA